MSRTKVKTCVKRLADELAGDGFLLDGPYRVKRKGEVIDQQIELQPGHRSLADSFTCNVCWSFDFPGKPKEAFDFRTRLGQLFDEGDVWFKHTAGEADKSCDQVVRLVKKYAVPFLDRHLDLASLVASCEEASKSSEYAMPPLDPRMFFAQDEGWRHYNLGFAHRHLGDHERAKAHLREAIEEDGGDLHEWIQERNRVCAEALRQLGEE